MNVIKVLKDFCPLRFLFRIKYLRFFFKQSELNITTRTGRIFYLDAPDYGNVGDQAIALAIQKFTEKIFPDYTFIEVSQNELMQYARFLKKEIQKEDIIFLTGGGNMGNIYRIFEATRRYVIRNFPNNKIIIFPQTIEYTNDFWGRCSSRAAQKLYGAHKNLYLCAREKYSFEKMKQLYPSANVILCPDIALLLSPVASETGREGIGICLRNDCEKVLTEAEQAHIVREAEKLLPVKYITTTANVTGITCRNRETVVKDKLVEIAGCRLLITDRLHAMVFCALTHTPCIVFRNNNMKITGVYEWLREIPYIYFAETTDKLTSILSDMLKREYDQGESISRMAFEDIVHAVRKE